MEEPMIDGSVPLSNRNGIEVIFVIMQSLFYSLLVVFLETHFKLKKNVCFFLEICILVVPEILGMTLWSDHCGFVLYIVLMISGLVLAWFYQKTLKLKKNIAFDTAFITNTRSILNILTVIAILAVDFNIFPHRFGKTETEGYSLMDTGVGLFVFANGIVSPESRGLKNPIKKSIKGSLTLLIVGIGRFILTQLFNYHVAAYEYGVHWNFFITLGVIKIFTSFFLNVVSTKYVYINAIMMLFAHEVILQSGLKEFVFEDKPRDNFFKANKEGISSSLGFITLYLFSVHFGYVLNLKEKKQSAYGVFKKHVISWILFLIFCIVLQHYFGISRRVANSAYVCWILFLGISLQTILYLTQIFQKAIFRTDIVIVPYIFQAINYNGLTFFLVANVLTGIINITINTREYNELSSFFIIFVYMIINLLIVTFMYAKGIQLKF